MIIEALLNPIFGFLKGIFGWINMNDLNLPTWIDDTLRLLAKAMMFFPIDVWVIIIINIVFWITIQFAWAVIEWIYRKIPGIN